MRAGVALCLKWACEVHARQGGGVCKHVIRMREVGAALAHLRDGQPVLFACNDPRRIKVRHSVDERAVDVKEKPLDLVIVQLLREGVCHSMTNK
eukprot:scaffold97649_cov29-Tisochrysis_lutea.AAC.8